MAADHRFYKRFNFASVPMEEYEVRDAGRRSESPDLTLVPTPPMPGSAEIILLISNAAPQPANHVVIRIFIDAQAKILMSGGWNMLSDQLNAADNTKIPVTVLHLNWSVPNKLPIWEGEAFRVCDERPLVGFPPSAREYLFGLRLSSPRMSPKQRYFSVASNGSTISVSEHQFRSWKAVERGTDETVL